MKSIKGIVGALLGLMFVVFSLTTHSEPWIDTRDEHLRADIEMLSDIGIVKVPISTFPLMWSGVIKDIEQYDISEVPANYKEVYWRVKQSGKKALANKEYRELKVSAANSEQVIRNFGDAAREKAELSGRSHRMTKNFAWNIEVTQAYEPRDDKKTRYDGSYIAGVHSNWIFAVGAIEKWWGASWSSSNILSNNARPPLGIMIQRNYSEASEMPILEWLGPWTLNSFVAKLDDERVIKDAQVTGMSLNFKPHHSLEVGMRASALWGGVARTNSFDSFIDNFIANESCILNPSPSQYFCDDDYSDTGDRMAGIDFRWRLPVSFPIAVYGSGQGESDREFLPGKLTKQFGVTSSFTFNNTVFKWFLEHSDTSLDGEFNHTYESQVYQSGYRYYGRNIGSNLDNDSKSVSFGMFATINKNNKFRFKISKHEINRDSLSANDFAQHSLTDTAQDVSQLQFGWIHNTSHLGNFDISFDHFDNEFQNVSNRLSVSWSYEIL